MAGNDRGDRKSWRERDAQKDRGATPRRDERDKPPGFGTAAATSSRHHRAALDALFEKGGFAKLAEKLQSTKVEPAVAPAPPAPLKARVVPAAEDENKASLRRKILEAIGRDEISRAVDRYVKEHPLPEDFEVLEQVIEHRKLDRMTGAMSIIEKMLDKAQPKRSRLLNAKLRHIEETTDEKDVRDQAIRIRGKLV